MIKYIPVVFTGIACFIAWVIMLRDYKKWNIATETDDMEMHIKSSYKGMMIYAIVMSITTIVEAVIFCGRYSDYGAVHNLKRLLLLSIMWPIAYIDFKTFRIPNSYIILGLVYRGIILLFEFINGGNDLKSILISELIAAGALLLATVLCAICIKNSIGFGDIKLFVVMGLMLGTEGVWNAVFLSLIVSFVIAGFLLITKKKGRKDFIPFGPAIAIGTYLSICLTGV
ncbi:MAG: prepilin peptidase [Lachnospiraceae bacterium]|nr:prepilin peptidase [Lachnospiraceae bacterium]